ncbi:MULTISPECIES: hypothetical protein [Paenibacillus]|uniref:Fbf1 n=1 Tax=Paenibacillus polymyxa (strain SC2) TaxID=886882 RepID=E3EC17_PAEPS|nr:MULTISPECIES: hypothetical protein [Paenibacillus]ADO59357.1 fbf1 [Paenibacillus polymyxa SC2]AJE51680.1 hypothetical protein RE92_11860 [Paenibacillus polymyxa]KAF6563452.1 hypothetical protein G9G63_14785 [Paenibacillus sp. EKM202P]KAF6569952.1 hypothetical protein G9G64_10090 [Paenibacillus sp. EKM207P]MEE4568157.1 hypothetical protein [Paenibacillus polymyxa]
MRWLGWLLKKGMTVVLVSALTLAVTGVVVNAYVQSLLRQFNIQLDHQPTWGWSWLKGSAGTDQSTGTGKSKTTGSDSGGVTPPDNALPVMGQGLEESGREAGGSSNGTVSQEGATSAGTSGSESRQQAEGTATPETSIEGHDLVITPDHLTEKKNNLPAAQKQEIFTILMSKLPPEEMQKISAAMEGGLTEQELQDIQQVLAKYLTKEEYNKLMGMLK